MTTVLVTGATGFVGRYVTKALEQTGAQVRLAVRETRPDAPSGAIAVGPIGETTDWSKSLDGVDAVVHLAGQLPARGVSATAFATINDHGTARLCEQAEAAGVKTFVGLSTIAVLGGHSMAAAVSDATPPAPVSPYGESKLAGEAHVLALARSGRLAIALRPPIIYGAESTGNWGQLQRLAASGFPLPFGSTRNRRSLLAVGNLADAIARLITRPADPVQSGAYCIADREALSTAEVVSALRLGMDRGPGLIPFPTRLISSALRSAGRGSLAESLFGDHVVDASRFETTFGWSPPLAARDAMAESGRRYVELPRAG